MQFVSTAIRLSIIFLLALAGAYWPAIGWAEAADTAGETAVAEEKSTDKLPLEATRQISFDTDEATWLSLDVAPDGQRLVLEILGDLYLLPRTGGTAEALTRGMAYDSQPRFSPDGKSIAFVSDRDGAYGLWKIPVEGGEPTKIADGGKRSELASPAWSPDGSHVIVSKTSWGLRTFELWAYHVDGGEGLQITKAKAAANTPANQRSNSLGAVYSPDGRYLYYARKVGGFAYNMTFPAWQIARRDLRLGSEDILTQAQGSAIRPQLSPDGELLVYGTRYEQQTGLRIRNLRSGEDRWLVYPVQHDEQESRFTRDLLPGYAFAPDGRSVIYTEGGGIREVMVADGLVSQIPFTATVEQELGPHLYFPYRLGLGPVKARLLMGPAPSPDGRYIAFSAFTRLYVFDRERGESKVVSPEGVLAFHPTWSPDSREVAYVDWSTSGGHVWRVRANGRGGPKQVSEQKAFYTDPAWSPDGERIVTLRAGSYDRLYREADFGPVLGSDLVWFPARGGVAELILPSRGYGRPHFGPESDRIYLYMNAGGFSSANAGLVSVRYDGTDRRRHIAAKGPGIYFAEENVYAGDIRISPDGRHALISHANQLYVARLLNTYLQNVEVNLESPAVPLTRVTDVGADFFSWANSDEMFWSVGNQVYQRSLDSIAFSSDKESNGNGTGNGTGNGAGKDEQRDGNESVSKTEPLREADEAVITQAIEVYLPRYEPEGTLALVGATILPMEKDDDRIEDGTVLIENDRIVAVGTRAEIVVPETAERLDMTGHFIVPGYVDTHAHFRPLRRILDTANWAFLANLAYGVTTGLDVQPSTTDILAYEDLIDAGLMIGPRALSTGPGVFSNNDFRSAEHAEAVLRRYRDHYGVRNLKAYLTGNRQQRQWVAQASAKLEMMPTTEGGLDMMMNMTHAIDGFSGNEHNFPVLDLYRDTVELVAQSGMSYTPTLLVTYGGPFAENYFYTRENPHRDPKLRRFTPANAIASRTLRTQWFLEEEFVFPKVAAQAAKIIRAGGRVGVGAHGQLQGLGYHWELWALASGGLTPREALTAATRHGAEIIGVAQDIGTVSAGKLADLVILDEDPLEDIRHSAAIAFVVKNGEVFEGETLNKVWPEQVPLPQQWWWNRGPETPAAAQSR
jgi:Tol biopolymer transport system component